ncbi:hypothetical protein [Roseomonas populi]|uniref:Uncharacterized protein n=1 Tax=Roseomonas populi TaxID=3121582 RepID=A0ABT1X7H0_9PROT|nr:hypothetical protein [Roseomonas pecuniae]MCR0984051.1 hypothetical protein [Roseomonas pecuniae]
MPTPAQLPHFLVLRPTLGHASRDGAYAHVEALVMYTRSEAAPARYGDLHPLVRWDDTPRPILHEGLRWTCQIDDRSVDAYGVHYGYTPEHTDVFTAADLGRYGKSIPALRRAMDRLQDQEGRTEDVALLLTRLARVLKVRGVVLLEPRTGESYFGEHHRIRYSAEAPNYGPMVAGIGEVVAELHRRCAARCGRVAA